MYIYISYIPIHPFIHISYIYLPTVSMLRGHIQPTPPTPIHPISYLSYHSVYPT